MARMSRFGGGGKVEGTGGGVMEVLVPCGGVKDGGRSGRRGDHYQEWRREVYFDGKVMTYCLR